MGFLLIVVLLITPPAISQPMTGIISGQVLDAETGEFLPQCNISLSPGNGGMVTDSLGLFAIPLEFGEYSLEFNYTGYKNVIKKVSINSTAPRSRLIIQLNPLIYKGEEIVVIGQSEEISPDVQTIDRIDLRQIPSLYSDVLRGIKILPGVTSNNELSIVSLL